MPLLKGLGFNNLDNPIMRVNISCADIKLISKNKIKNFYIQVFSRISSIFRIYLYKIDNQFKITIESFFNKNEIIDFNFVNKVLKKFKIEIKLLGKFTEKKKYVIIY